MKETSMVLSAFAKDHGLCPWGSIKFEDREYMTDQARKMWWNFLGNLGRPFFLRPIASFCEKYLLLYYSHLFWRQWHDKMPHWFDHRINIYRWSYHQNSHWLERGVYSKEVMSPGANILDIACGDGFYAYYFYALTAANVDCIDIDESAIRHAQRFHKHPKINYYHQDAVTVDFPGQNYDVVCLDGAIGHFTFDQLDILLPKIKRAMKPGGAFVGYEVMEREENKNWDHPIALHTREDFYGLLSPYFSRVETFASKSPGRQNMYFRCGDKESRWERFH
jgi:ubiquinone/menaquinone biosynthesis C-methylase UbiE